MKTNLATRLKQARTHAGITQEDAAARLNKSRHTYAKWEQGKTVPASLEDIVKLCDLYDISIDWLVRGKIQISAQDLVQLKIEIDQAIEEVLDKYK